MRTALVVVLTACGGGDVTCPPTEPGCGGGGGGGDGGGGGGGGGGQVANVVGSWDAVQVEGQPIPGNQVNYSGLPSVITEGALGLQQDGNWQFYVYADVPGQTPGGIGAGPMKVTNDYGTYTVQPQLTEDGLTSVVFASQAYPGYRFVGETDGQSMAFRYQMTESASSYLVFGFRRR